jgi:hypothetical protein
MYKCLILLIGATHFAHLILDLVTLILFGEN